MRHSTKDRTLVSGANNKLAKQKRTVDPTSHVRVLNRGAIGFDVQLASIWRLLQVYLDLKYWEEL